MGIHSDTKEDNEEREGQRLQSIAPLPTPSWVAQSPKLERCSLCGRQLPADDIAAHMYSHAGVSSYVIANNQIVRDVAYMDKRLESLDICSLGPEPAEVEVSVSGDKKWVGDIKGQYSFGDQFSELADGELEVRIIDFNGKRFHRLYIGSPPVLRYREIDRFAFESLFRPLDRGCDPEYDRYMSRVAELNPTPPEELYRNALHDFATGYRLVQCGKSQGGHLESALYGLSRFKTNFAVTGKRILALRMNCFGLLSDCEPTSRFFLASLLFGQPLDSRKEVYSAEILDSEYGVYIDAITEKLLDAVSAYYAADTAIFQRMVKDLWEIVPEYDTNSHVKILLLTARHWRRAGDTNEARANYAKLINDPDFGCEAQEFLS